jgi:integral membrane protein (TIGR01906 family)
MKKVLGTLAAVCWLVFGITGAVRWTAGDGGLLAAEMLQAAPPETSGLPEGEYPGVGTMTAEYLTGKREAFQYTVQGAEVFQEHEAAHMADCRDLIRLDTIVCILCGTAALLLTACGLWRRDGRRDFLRGAVYGMLGTAGVVLIFGIWAAVNFNGLFVTFHKVAFRNDGWLLNPKTDLLIRLMPISFFVRLGLRGLLRFAAVPAVMAAAVWIGLKKADTKGR